MTSLEVVKIVIFLQKINDFQGFEGSDIEPSSCRIFLALDRPGGLKNPGFCLKIIIFWDRNDASSCDGF